MSIPAAGQEHPLGQVPPPPPVAAEVFGDRLPIAVAYAGWLAGAGVERGLLGPREVDRIWPRHLLNCAAVAPLIAEGAAVVDLGAGAGLPGIVLAIARPDLQVTLIEPLLRRVTFLQECLADLGLPNVEVVRGRAEELARQVQADVVVSRAVAPLPRLLGWALPLLRSGGELLALKGGTAAEEIEASRLVLHQHRVTQVDVVTVSPGESAEAAEDGDSTTVVRVQAGHGLQVSGKAKRVRSTVSGSTRRASGGRQKR